MLGHVAPPSWPWQQCKAKPPDAGGAGTCIHTRLGTRCQGRELALPSDLHPRVGLPNSRARERLHQPQVTPGEKHGVGTGQVTGETPFASGSPSGAGVAWQETPRVAELQQGQ